MALQSSQKLEKVIYVTENNQILRAFLLSLGLSEEEAVVGVNISARLASEDFSDNGWNGFATKKDIEKIKLFCNNQKKRRIELGRDIFGAVGYTLDEDFLNKFVSFISYEIFNKARSVADSQRRMEGFTRRIVSEFGADIETFKNNL